MSSAKPGGTTAWRVHEVVLPILAPSPLQGLFCEFSRRRPLHGVIPRNLRAACRSDDAAPPGGLTSRLAWGLFCEFSHRPPPGRGRAAASHAPLSPLRPIFRPCQPNFALPPIVPCTLPWRMGKDLPSTHLCVTALCETQKKPAPAGAGDLHDRDDWRPELTPGRASVRSRALRQRQRKTR